MSDVTPAAPARNVPLEPAEFQRIAAFAHNEAGLVFPPGKRPMMESRLTRRLRARGLMSFSEYCALLDDPSEIGERRELVSALTTNVTSFFREPYHFEILQRTVLPPLMQRLRDGGRVRIWSAGCSTGQEAYCLAMTLLDQAPDIATMDCRILATDVDPAALRVAVAGRYKAAELGGLEPQKRATYFQAVPDTGEACAGNELRGLRRFRELNLLQDWPMRGQFDVIFCRNVVIYFDDSTQRRLWPRFAAANTDAGWLFLGHSERLAGPVRETYDAEGMTAYRHRSSRAEN